MNPETRPAGWLFKTEPTTYSWDDLVKAKTATWDGVRNPQALANLRKARKDDPVFIYHTGDEKSVIGIARITREAYPDPKEKDSRLLVVDLEAVKPLPRRVTLSAVKVRLDLGTFPLVRLPRLSVMPVTESEWKTILEMAGTRE
jgi:predicted RNA-binding protein with PUA-like domain